MSTYYNTINFCCPIDPTLQNSVLQYHPYKQKQLLEQSVIYQPNLQPNQFHSDKSVIEYYYKVCAKKI